MVGPFGLQPVRVTEDAGRAWTVVKVIDHGRDKHWRLFGPMRVTEWWRLRVEAMTPGPAGEWRTGVVEATKYSDRGSWWLEFREE